MRWTLLLCVGALACATGRSSRVETQDLPRWMTERDEVRYALIEHFLEVHDMKRALEIARVLRDEGVVSPLLDLYQGMALRDQGMLDDALRLLEAARTGMRRDPRPYRELCVLYADLEKLDQAVAACDRAVNLDDQDAVAWNNLGYLLLAEDRPAEAQDALEKAVDLDGTMARYRNNLGIAQAAAGREDRALRTFMSTSSRADAHYNVGAAVERFTSPDGALGWYRRALQFDSSHDLATEAVERLTSPRQESP
ncbi:MAG: tetratricopeptide (TPR) repeat protein [Myxococcota bacterium]